ncbi:LytR/AlgR family response regulator transcription factor [Deminuibacter soli]|uniref:DNA-binding response regulator n=1 Tax=Deminuibacter soli TaxID=2291815 RepID=A0A3E1NRI1_9BACT|nr:response regulator transcription factor [Deminuibacter soli]RFM30532.1 DNA-binding response regulator [Deminuibacter soli]
MEQLISCVIIDDEPLGLELIEKYIKRIPSLRLVAKWDNAIEALDQMERLRPMLVFLDVNMPEMSGIEFIRTFNHYKPQIILTTAYSEYAVQGYEYDVTDFILKPVTFERFARAINKVKERLSNAQKSVAMQQAGETTAPAAEQPEAPPVQVPGMQQNRQLLIKENKKFINISIDDIYVVEGMKDYLKIHTKARVIVTHMTMGKMEDTLPPTDFLRINRSYIVRKAAVKAINGNTIELLNNVELPIGIKYREIIKHLMDKGSL